MSTSPQDGRSRPRPGRSNASGRIDYDQTPWGKLLNDPASLASLQDPRSADSILFRRRSRLPTCSIAESTYPVFNLFSLAAISYFFKDAYRFRCQFVSVRKDVEDFFGILKARFRILKLPFEVHTKRQIDKIMFACVTLHNMLHSFDCRDEWEA